MTLRGNPITRPIRTARHASLAAAGQVYRALRGARRSADGHGSFAAGLRRLRADFELREAIADEQFTLHYQPIVRLATTEVVSYEALIRWTHPSRGPVPTGQFIPTAEETDQIVPIGAWVLRESCRQLRAWRDADPSASSLSVCVNVSGRQLAHPGFLPHLRDVLRETAVDPDSLKLEITESVMVEDDAEKVLWKIKDLGVALHMDDFGTGYSSLSCLHRFPIDVLKIDRSFVRNTAACRDYASVLHAIVSLAHNLGMDVVAEGLETPSQVALLHALDADYGQGFFFSKPLPADQAALLHTRGLPTPMPLAKSA